MLATCQSHSGDYHCDQGRVVYVTPNHDACGRVDPPPPDMDLPWIALISRGPCHFDKKVSSGLVELFSQQAFILKKKKKKKEWGVEGS